MINNIIELCDYLQDFDWGYKSVDGDVIVDDFSTYRTLTPIKFLEDKCGVCWDYVNYEANWFDEHGFTNTIDDLQNMTYSLLYMQSEDKEEIPTHTWLMFRYNGTIYSFEASWKSNVGVLPWTSEEECIQNYVDNFLHEEQVEHIEIWKYKNFKIYNQLCDDFMLYCTTSGEKIR